MGCRFEWGCGWSSPTTRIARGRSVSGFAEGPSVAARAEFGVPDPPLGERVVTDQLARCPTQEENTGVPRQVLPGPDWLPDPTASTA